MGGSNYPTILSTDIIDRAAAMLLDAAPATSEVILFGSYARGDADASSDLDFMVIEPVVADARGESVRLRRALVSIHAAIDVLVVSRARFERWKTLINNVVAEAAEEGKVYRRGA